MSRCEVPSETIFGESSVDAREDGNAVVVVPAGEFDLPAAGLVREALVRAMSDPRRRLIVDLSEVTFIDSSGLHLILDTYELCRETGRTLTIRPGSPTVQHVFELAKLLECLPFER